MRKFLVLMLLWMATPVIAEESPLRELTLPILCGPTENLLKGLKRQYDEEIIFMAPSQNQVGDNLFHSLWINTETTTWSFIVVNKKRNTTCIISSGDGSKTWLTPQGEPT